MKGFVRSCLAVLAGAFITVTLVAIGEGAGHAVFPPPEGLKFDMNDLASMKDVMEKIPLGAKVVVVVVWGIATLVGSWFATWVAAKLNRRSFKHGIAVGIIIMLATLSTLAMFPHPVWMWISGIGVVLLGTYIGAMVLGKDRPPGKPVVLEVLS